MSATPPPSPAPVLVDPGQASSSTHPSAQTLQPKTPPRSSSAAHSVPGITPCSRGTSVRSRQEGNTDRVDGYKRDEYDDYVREDLRSRVFIDFEVFMKSVLHVPTDWKEEWKSMIEAVKKDSAFAQFRERYRQCCEDSKSLEEEFYEPLMETANAVLNVLSQLEFPKDSGIPHRYHVNAPKVVRGGVIDKVGLIPDLVVLHEGREPGGRLGLHWANPLHVLEVKPYDNALCTGVSLPRLVVDGVDPISNHAPHHRPSRFKAKESSRRTTSAHDSGSAAPKSKKRPVEGSRREDSQPPTKKSRLDATSEDGEDFFMSATEYEVQVQPALQVCRYLMEMFSVPLLRSHATVGLVDRDHLQLYHANRSVILVSSAIDFSGGDGLDKFIAVIIAFRCLSPEQNGILDALVDGNVELTKNSTVPKDKKVVQAGKKLKLPTSGPDAGKFTLTLGDVIYRDPAILGRSTVVLRATSDGGHWGENLVVKVSYPGSRRISENKFIDKAKKQAQKTEGGWATKHLPEVFYSEDVDPGENSTLESVASLFKDPKYASPKQGPTYERRTLRIIVQEELQPLKSLKNARDIGQAFLDIACIHRWLYDKPGILHRDLSLRNIMCRIVKEINANGQEEQKVYGVLTDYDLSSWTEHLKGDYTRTSQQRTGTPPYMAQELLKGTSTSHLYRHDVESLFYVMLLTCARHSFDKITKKVTKRVDMRDRRLPYEDWFDEPNYERLGGIKRDFFLEKQTLYLSPDFEDFRKWLDNIRKCLNKGFKAKIIDEPDDPTDWQLAEEGGSADEVKPTPEPFDDETLGGNVEYSAIIKPVPYLQGELKGLTVRYESK